MLSLFRTNQVVANILLVLYAFIIRLASFLVPPQPTDSGGNVLFESLFHWVAPQSKTTAILSLLLVCFQALLVNIILSRHRMANELTLLPGMFYVFLASCFPDFLYLSPALVATTFYLLALSEMFDTYKNYSAAGKIFNIGLWMGIASLFYSSMLVYLLLAIIGLRSLRAFRFREQLILLGGFIAPYFLTFVYFFINDKQQFFWQKQFAEGFSLFDFEFHWNWYGYVKLGFFTFLILMAVVNFNGNMLKKNIQVQKNITILYWGIIIALLAMLIQADVSLNHLFLLVPSLAIFLSFSFLKLHRSLAEVFHLLLLFIVLVLQFQNWWLVG